MTEIISSVIILFSVVFTIVFLVHKSMEITHLEEEYSDYLVKIKIVKKRRDCIGKRKNSG